MDLERVERELLTEETTFAVLDEHGTILHLMNSESFRDHSEFEGAVAVAAGRLTSKPLLVYRPTDPPLPLIRNAVSHGWGLDAHQGWT